MSDETEYMTQELAKLRADRKLLVECLKQLLTGQVSPIFGSQMEFIKDTLTKVGEKLD